MVRQLKLKCVEVRRGLKAFSGWAERNTRRTQKSLRNGFHHANAVVWEPV